jgi:hypothetical protein
MRIVYSDVRLPYQYPQPGRAADGSPKWKDLDLKSQRDLVRLAQRQPLILRHFPGLDREAINELQKRFDRWLKRRVWKALASFGVQVKPWRLPKDWTLEPPYAPEFDPLHQEARLALLGAIKRYNWKSENGLNAYARDALEGAIHDEIKRWRLRGRTAGTAGNEKESRADRWLYDHPWIHERGVGWRKATVEDIVKATCRSRKPKAIARARMSAEQALAGRESYRDGDAGYDTVEPFFANPDDDEPVFAATDLSSDLSLPEQVDASFAATDHDELRECDGSGGQVTDAQWTRIVAGRAVPTNWPGLGPKEPCKPISRERYATDQATAYVFETAEYVRQRISRRLANIAKHFRVPPECVGINENPHRNGGRHPTKSKFPIPRAETRCDNPLPLREYLKQNRIGQCEAPFRGNAPALGVIEYLAEEQSLREMRRLAKIGLEKYAKEHVAKDNHGYEFETGTKIRKYPHQRHLYAPELNAEWLDNHGYKFDGTKWAPPVPTEADLREHQRTKHLKAKATPRDSTPLLAQIRDGKRFSERSRQLLIAEIERRPKLKAKLIATRRMALVAVAVDNERNTDEKSERNDALLTGSDLHRADGGDHGDFRPGRRAAG